MPSDRPLPFERRFAARVIHPLPDETDSAGIGGRASRIIAEHRVASFLVTAGVIIAVADAIRRVMPDETRTSVVTWVALGLMAYAIFASVYVLKRFPPDKRNVVAWGVAVSPAVYGYAATLFGSPVVVMWIGVVLAVVLTGFVVLVARPSDEGG